MSGKRSSNAKARLAEKQHAAKQAVYDKTPERFKNATSLQVRFRTGAVYVGVSVLCVLLGDIPTMIYLSVVSAVCAGEFFYMMRVASRLPNEVIGIVGAALYPVAMWRYSLTGAALVTLLLMLALLVWYVYYMRSRITDVGVAGERVYHRVPGLDYLPLVQESLDVVAVKTPATKRAVKALRDLLRNPGFRSEFDDLVGVDTSRMGAVTYEC